MKKFFFAIIFYVLFVLCVVGCASWTKNHFSVVDNSSSIECEVA